MVISCLDYCLDLPTGLPACAVKPLQMVSGLQSAWKSTRHPSVRWAPLATLTESLMLGYKALNGTAPIYLNDSVTPVVKGLSSSSAYTMLKTIQTLFMCRSTMVEWPFERYKNRRVPVYLQETLEDPAHQRASPTPRTYSVLPSIPALCFYTVTPVTSDRAWLVVSFYIAYC